MPRACMCDICHFHRQSGAPLYAAGPSWQQLTPLQQRIQLERHEAHGACPILGPPFALHELTLRQQERYHALYALPGS